MANNIHGPLYYERMGRTGPVVAFIHPNPMDQSCWMYQMAHLSTWYRCISIDIPGYGRSPKADVGLTMADMADACWEAIDDAFSGEDGILVGCSIGSAIAPHMYHRNVDRTAAMVLSGTGYNPGKPFAKTRIENYAAIACPTIILTGSEDNSHQRAFALQERIPGCQLKVLPGAGHACQLEQPWLFDQFMIEFLSIHGLFPGEL